MGTAGTQPRTVHSRIPIRSSWWEQPIPSPLNGCLCARSWRGLQGELGAQPCQGWRPGGHLCCQPKESPLAQGRAEAFLCFWSLSCAKGEVAGADSPEVPTIPTTPMVSAHPTTSCHLVPLRGGLCWAPSRARGWPCPWAVWVPILSKASHGWFLQLGQRVPGQQPCNEPSELHDHHLHQPGEGPEHRAGCGRQQLE